MHLAEKLMAIRTVDFSQVSDGIAGGADTTLSAGGLTFTISAPGAWSANFDGGRFNFIEDASFGASLFRSLSQIPTDHGSA